MGKNKKKKKKNKEKQQDDGRPIRHRPQRDRKRKAVRLRR